MIMFASITNGGVKYNEPIYISLNKIIYREKSYG
jgi:hypothetical protein